MSKNPKGLSKLPPKQQVFVTELLADPDFSLTKAAVKAGYSSPGSAGSKLMNNPSVAKIVGDEMNKRAERTNITADRVLQEIASIAFANVKDMVNDDGTIKMLSEMPEEVSAAISSISVRQVSGAIGGDVSGSQVDVDFYNKMDALHLLCKHLGIGDARIPETAGMDVTKLLTNMLEAVETNKVGYINDTMIEDLANE